MQTSDECVGLICAESGPEMFDSVVVLREATAIWCSVCAVSDPLIDQFVEERGQQVSRIALHPDDGIDTLGNRLSTHQVWQLGSDPLTIEYPTYWMGNAEPRSGIVSSNQLHKQFLAEASEEMKEVTISTRNLWSVEQSLDHYPILIEASFPAVENGTYSLFITEDDVEIANPDDYNGIRFHNDVARAGALINSTDGSLMFSEPNDGWSVGGFQVSPERTELSIIFRFPIDSEMSIDNSRLTVLAEDSEGINLGAASAPPRGMPTEGGDVWSVVALVATSLAAIMLAIPALVKKNQRKPAAAEEHAAESEE